jgi:hypothetical protein
MNGTINLSNLIAELQEPLFNPFGFCGTICRFSGQEMPDTDQQLSSGVKEVA